MTGARTPLAVAVRKRTARVSAADGGGETTPCIKGADPCNFDISNSAS